MYIDDDKCFECGEPMSEWHHVIPKSLGGTKMIPLCGGCHDRVHGWGNKRRDHHAELTKAGIAKSKANGGKFGADVIPPEAMARGLAKSREVNMAQALAFAESLSDKLLHLRNQDMTLQEISVILNDEGPPTQRGGKWYPTTICNIFEKLGIPTTKKLGVPVARCPSFVSTAAEDSTQTLLSTSCSAE